MGFVSDTLRLFPDLLVFPLTRWASYTPFRLVWVQELQTHNQLRPILKEWLKKAYETILHKSSYEVLKGLSPTNIQGALDTEDLHFAFAGG